MEVHQRLLHYNQEIQNQIRHYKSEEKMRELELVMRTSRLKRLETWSRRESPWIGAGGGPWAERTREVCY